MRRTMEAEREKRTDRRREGAVSPMYPSEGTDEVTNTEAIKAILNELPMNLDGFIPDDKREEVAKRDYVILETERHGEVILFCRVEDIGADANPDDTVCMAIGYEITLTVPRDVKFDAWSIYPFGDRLAIMHHPGTIASGRPPMHSPGAVVTRARFYRGITGHRLGLDSDAMPEGFNPPTDLDEARP